MLVYMISAQTFDILLFGMTHLPISVILNHWPLLKQNLKLWRHTNSLLLLLLLLFVRE